MIQNSIMIFFKTIFMNICISYSFIKIKGIKHFNKNKMLNIIILDLIFGVIYGSIYNKIIIIFQPIIFNIIIYLLYLFLIVLYSSKIDKDFPIIAIISMMFSFCAYLIACLILYLCTRLSFLSNIIDSIIEYFVAGILQFILIYYFFRTKRFKDGFHFLQEESVLKDVIKVVVLFLTLIAIWFPINKIFVIDQIILILISIGLIVCIVLIKKAITLNYKSKLKDQTVELLNNQIKEKDAEIESLKEELKAVLKINHKYNHRISSAEKAISQLKFNTEMANENTEIIKLIENLSKDYKEELSNIEIPTTNIKTEIYGIDSMIEYMSNTMKKDNIEFILEVKCNVKEMIENNIINQNKLETLLGDHLNDAIIAIKYSKANTHKIKLVFDKKDNIYKIKIYDTGIEFEIDTLLKLGKEQITTHKDSGGSGIGFVTTFETLKECKGSLIIEEYKNSEDNYTKAIIISFDNKNEYKVRSYRADEVTEQNFDNRVIVEKI